MSIVKIKDNVSLSRDTTSGAIINTNSSLYQKRLNEIEALKNQKAEKEQFDEEFNNLKTDVNEIKTLLKNLLASKE
jgi:cell shape-determining protein MreC